MRIAAILAILARTLTREIFSVSYLFKDEIEFRTALLNVADTKPEKEQLCRGLLLSIDPDTQYKMAKKKGWLVVDKVMESAGVFLTGPNADDFRVALNAIVKDAIALWLTVQKSKTRLEADVTSGSDWEWKQLPSSIGSSANGGGADAKLHGTNGSQDQLIACCFPRVFAVISPDEEDVSIFPGVALMASQTLAAKAELERTPRPVESPSLTRARTTRHGNQRASVSSSGPGYQMRNGDADTRSTIATAGLDFLGQGQGSGSSKT